MPKRRILERSERDDHWDDELIDQIIEEVEGAGSQDYDDELSGVDDLSLGTLQEIWSKKKGRARY